MQEDQQKELTSLLEMAKENGVGWRKEKALTKNGGDGGGECERRMVEDEGFGSKT